MGRRLAAAVIGFLALTSSASAATWQDLPGPKTARIGAFAASPTVAGLAWANADGRPVVTHDSGRSWTPGPSPAPVILTSPATVNAPPVADATASRWWRTAGNELQRSDDDGATWQVVDGLSKALAAVDVRNLSLAAAVRLKQLLADPVRSGVLYAVAWVGDEREANEIVLQSRDGGTTWEQWSRYAFVFDAYDHGFQDTWIPLPGRDALLLVSVGGAGDDVHEEVDVVGHSGGTLYSHKGRRGAGDEQGGPLLGLTLTGRAVLDATGDRVLVESNAGWSLLRTHGGGARRLSPVLRPDRIPPAFDPMHARRIYALRDGRVSRSDDDGAHWRSLASGLNGALGLVADSGGVLTAFGPGGLATSSDGGRTFSVVDTLGAPVAINSVHDDGHGALLAATAQGVWRIGADGRWVTAEHDVFPRFSLCAAPLGRTRGLLVLRYGFGKPGGARLEAVAPGGAARAIPTPASLPSSGWRTCASDALARGISLGADWTTTGGRRWHLAPAGATSLVAGTARVTYATRHGGTRTPTTLWRRAGDQPWKRMGSFAGYRCRPVAGGAQRVYVFCSDGLLRSDDAGRTVLRIGVPEPMEDVLSMAVDPRRPDHVALLLRTYADTCQTGAVVVTLTSADGGSSWSRIADACDGPAYDSLAIAPGGLLLRWSNAPGALQALDGWSA